MKITLYTSFIILVMFLSSCASQKPPTGGPKDVVPPRTDTIIPSNHSTNFHQQSFSITFNEPIASNNLEGNIIINPYDEDLEIKSRIRKNKLEISWNKPLLPNTTYSFILDDCIKDITESNKANNLTYTFSTGSSIDSGYISGLAVNQEKNTPVANCMVGLYTPSDTLDITKHRPLYYTYTNKEGEFLLEHLPNKTFELYLIEDKNKDRKYQNNEAVSFLMEPVRVDSFIEDIQLSVFIDDNIKPNIKTETDYSNIYQYTYDERIRSITIVDSSYQLLPSIRRLFNPKNKTLQIYVTNDTPQKLHLLATDLSGNTDTTQVDLAFQEPDTNFYEKLTLVPLRNYYRNPNDSLIFESNYLLDSIVSDSILVHVDTTKNVSKTIYLSDNQIIIKDIGAISKKISIQFSPKSLFSSNQVTNKTLNTLIYVYDPTSFGSIKGSMKDSSLPVLKIELINGNGQTTHSSTNSRFNFKDIVPETYQLKATIDLNNNNQWDPGNFETHELPEPIIIHKQDITIKSNFKLEDIYLENY